MAQTFAKGSTAGMQCALGFAAAGVCHTLLLVAGLSIILQTSKLVYQAVLIAGALYLIYLGVISIFESFKSSEQGDNKQENKAEHAVFYQAMITELLNPKVALFFLALIPQFTDSSLTTPMWLQLLIFGLLYPLIAFPVDILYVKSGNKIAHYFRHHPNSQKWIDISAGCIFILLALRLMLELI
jgi:threonine/homoserine/homoserine lactone efflux protein